MRHKKIFLALIALTLLLLAYALPSSALEVKEQKLSNGLTVLHVERHATPIVVATLLIKASPLDEPAERAGIANLTAKMLTEGTATRTFLDISEAIEFIGASLGTDTTQDFTTISLSVLKKDVEKGFELFSDVLLNPVFPENELKRRKALIKGALQQSEEDPAFVAEKRFRRELYDSHAYGRLVEGNPESIERISRDEVLAFYKKYYHPGRALLAVVGDITPQELNTLLERYLGKWDKSHSESVTTQARSTEPGTQPLQVTPAPEGSDPKTVVINKEVTQATIIFGNKGISRETPDYYAASVMNYILGGGGFSSRLMRVVRDELGLVYSIYSSFVALKYPGWFETEAQTKNETAGTVIREIVQAVRRIKTEPVSDQELADAKAFLTGSFPRRFETSRRIADFLTISRFYNLGDDYIQKYPGYINRITKEDVARVAKKYLTADNYTLVVVGDKKQLKLSDLQGSEKVK